MPDGFSLQPLLEVVPQGSGWMGGGDQEGSGWMGGPALSSQFHEKQQKLQSCILSPAQSNSNLSRIFTTAAWARGSQKINPYPESFSSAEQANPPHSSGEEEEMWDGGAALQGQQNLNHGWDSSGSPGSHSHQNPPEP